MNSYVSLYAADDDGDETIMESLSSLAESSPEDKIIDRERVQTLTNEILKVLSPLETKVFRLYLTGMNYAEIARVLECEEKSMDNALQRIKRKIRKSVLVTE